MLGNIVKILRPQQWLKNCLVFMGVLFGHGNHDQLLSSLSIFTAFCCVASSVYIINDLADFIYDQMHPIKSQRPIARGKISKLAASITALILLVTATSLLIQQTLVAQLILISYFIINILYSLFFKEIVFVDVIIITFGMLLRILAGTSGIGIAPSGWLLA